MSSGYLKVLVLVPVKTIYKQGVWSFKELSILAQFKTGFKQHEFRSSKGNSFGSG